MGTKQALGAGVGAQRAGRGCGPLPQLTGPGPRARKAVRVGFCFSPVRVLHLRVPVSRASSRSPDSHAGSRPRRGWLAATSCEPTCRGRAVGLAFMSAPLRSVPASDLLPRPGLEPGLSLHVAETEQVVTSARRKHIERKPEFISPLLEEIGHS